MVITEIFNTEYPLKSTEIENKNGTALIKLPYFFPESENQLFLTAAEYKGSVYLSDNGSAFRELSARTDDAYVTGDVFTYLAGVFLNIKPNEKKEIVWAVSPCDMRRFYRFLQCVSICANADLYPFIDENRYAECSAYVTRFDFPSGAYPAEFAEAVRTSLYPKYDKLITPFTFSGESSAMCIKAEETRDGGVSLTDAGGFDARSVYIREVSAEQPRRLSPV